MGTRTAADATTMVARSPARFLHQRLRLALFAAVLLIAEAFLLALAVFVWWPLAFVAIVPLVLLARNTTLGGLLDPVTIRRGIQGEERVAAVLAELEADGYEVIHDVEIGRGNADHILVGPTGVFVIETKDWGGRFYPRRGRLMFNNRPADHIVDQATMVARTVKRRLKRAGIDVWVEAVIASTRASVSSRQIRLGHVTVVEASKLPAFVRGRSSHMDPDRASRAAEVLSRP
ncbi:MAG TPA: NERD domain-containing protein [Actinomycetota bacterium]|jgi:hypothetical protein